MRIYFCLLFSFLFSIISIAQNTDAFCKAAEQGKLKKIERLFKKEIGKRKNGTISSRGPDKGVQINHINDIDSLTMWLKIKPCVADAASDKCEIKISIYPGWFVIGAIFKSANRLHEKYFYTQDGTTGNIKNFGWRPQLFKPKNTLVYKKMYNCPAFVKEQQLKCNSFK